MPPKVASGLRSPSTQRMRLTFSSGNLHNRSARFPQTDPLPNSRIAGDRRNDQSELSITPNAFANRAESSQSRGGRPRYFLTAQEQEPTGDKADQQGYQQRGVDPKSRSPGAGYRLGAGFEPMGLAGGARRRQALNEPARDPACLR